MRQSWAGVLVLLFDQFFFIININQQIKLYDSISCLVRQSNLIQRNETMLRVINI